MIHGLSPFKIADTQALTHLHYSCSIDMETRCMAVMNYVSVMGYCNGHMKSTSSKHCYRIHLKTHNKAAQVLNVCTKIYRPIFRRSIYTSW